MGVICHVRSQILLPKAFLSNGGEGKIDDCNRCKVRGGSGGNSTDVAAGRKRKDKSRPRLFPFSFLLRAIRSLLMNSDAQVFWHFPFSLSHFPFPISHFPFPFSFSLFPFPFSLFTFHFFTFPSLLLPPYCFNTFLIYLFYVLPYFC